MSLAELDAILFCIIIWLFLCGRFAESTRVASDPKLLLVRFEFEPFLAICLLTSRDDVDWGYKEAGKSELYDWSL